MKILLTTAICMFAFAGLALAQNKSVYTGTSTKVCKTVKQTDDGAGSYEGDCPGVGGYRLRLLEGDIRQTIDIITPAKKRFELNFWSFYGGFSAIGEKVEWRVKGTVPVALIARYNVSRADDEQKNDSYLMISKIGAKESCVVDVIMPGPKQNEEARIAADKAPTMPCKSNE